MRAMERRVVARGIASAGLAVLSVGLISLIERLPYSHLRDVVSDSLRLPAAFIAGTLAPQGIHGRHPILWLYAGIIALPLTYAIFWFVVLSLLAMIGRRTRHREA